MIVVSIYRFVFSNTLTSPQRLRQTAFGKPLKANRFDESVDRLVTDRSKKAVSRRRIRPAVMHGVANLDTGGEAVEHHATDFVLQDVYQIEILLKILLGAVKRRRQVTIKRARKFEHLVF